MTSSFRIGRVAGIEIGANWSWLIVVALIVFSLAANVFPITNPDLPAAAYVVMALVAALAFFASLTLHELGHAVQAQREGMRIEGITLWLFGGVARFSGRFPSAGAELRIAVAGPAVTLVLGLAFLAVALAVPLPNTVAAVVFWLAQINFILLVFNLLPALPLDGGRILRALLWGRRDDFAAATRTAAGLGKLFGQFLIAFGLVLVLFGGGLGGVWLAFIGLFLLGAAAAEAQQGAVGNALRGIRVRDVMVGDPVTVASGTTLRRFMDDVFFPSRHTAYPVLEPGGRAAGLLSFRAAARRAAEEWDRVRVEEVMQPASAGLVVGPGDDLADVFGELASSDLRRALVCDGGRLEGLLSVTDVTRVLEARGVRT